MLSLLLLGAIVCPLGAWTALKGIRAPSEKLLAMADAIGTTNPILARIVCWLAFIPTALTGLACWCGLAYLGCLMLLGVAR